MISSERTDIVEIPHEAKFVFEMWMKEYRILEASKPGDPDNPRKAMEYTLEDLT